MKPFIPFVFAVLFAGPLAAESHSEAGDAMLFAPATMADLSEFRWPVERARNIAEYRQNAHAAA